MSPQPVRAESAGPFRGMLTERAEQQPDETLVHYARNLLPADPVHGGPYVSRPGRRRLGTGSLGTFICWFGHWTQPNGTTLNVAVVTPAVNQLEIRTYDFGTDTWTVQVTTANFTTAGISQLAQDRANPWYVVPFAGVLVFGNQGGTPWRWDGTAGAGGLLSLGNAGVTFFGPTVYYGKLFFVKNTERATIIWSEENQPNTGYEAGGFNNAWTLSQTGQRVVYALVGTNEALYYFRSGSIGVIRGAVTTDFSGSGTHDSISTTIGTGAPDMVRRVGQEIWFVNWEGVPHYIPPGGAPVPISPWGWRELIQDVKPHWVEEPFGFSAFGDIVWQPAPAPKTQQAIVVPPTVAQPYTAVWFVYHDSGTSDGRIALVYCAETHLPIGWVTFPITASPDRSAWPWGVFVNAGNGVEMPVFGDGNEFAYRIDPYKSTSPYGRDELSDGSTVAYSAFLIGRPHFSNRAVSVRVDALDLVLTAPSQVTVGVQWLTSLEATASALPVAATFTGPGNDTVTGPPRHVEVSSRAEGRWIRPVLQFTPDGSHRSFAVDGYTIRAHVLGSAKGA